MKLGSLQKRLDALMPDPGPDPEEAEDDKLLMQTFEDHFLERLQEMGCSEVVGELKAAIATVGPRPFGHTRRDDRPYWVPLDEVMKDHWVKCGWRMKAALFLAWADVCADLGGSEETIAEYRKVAEEHLEYELRPGWAPA